MKKDGKKGKQGSRAMVPAARGQRTRTATLKPTWTTISEVLRERHPKASLGEMKMLFLTARRLGLDPLTNDLHLIPFKDSESGLFKSVLCVGIDAFRKFSEESGKYAGMDPITFNGGKTADECVAAGTQYPDTATCTVYRLEGGQKAGVTMTAIWKECYPRIEKNRMLWDQRPFHMLAKCAEAFARRAAFPKPLSGFYTPEELMVLSDKVPPRDVTPRGKALPDSPERQSANRELHGLLGKLKIHVEGFHRYVKLVRKDAGNPIEHFTELTTVELKELSAKLSKMSEGRTREIQEWCAAHSEKEEATDAAGK